MKPANDNHHVRLSIRIVIAMWALTLVDEICEAA